MADQVIEVKRRCSTCRWFHSRMAQECREEGCDGWNGGNQPKCIALKKLSLQGWTAK